MREFEGSITPENHLPKEPEEVILSTNEDELADALLRISFYEISQRCLLTHPQIQPGEERISEPGEAFLTTQDQYEGWSKSKRPYKNLDKPQASA